MAVQPLVLSLLLLLATRPSAAQDCHVSSVCSEGQFCDAGGSCEDSGGDAQCDGYGLGEMYHAQCGTDAKETTCAKSCAADECIMPPAPVVCVDGTLCGFIPVIDCTNEDMSECAVSCPNFCEPNEQPPGQCADCPAGRFIDASAVNPLAMQCEACPAGKFGSGVGQASCTSCAPGSQTSVAGLIECGPCNLGSIPNSAQDGCDACPGGQYSTDGVSCAECPAGQLLDSTSSGAATVSAACNECPAGQYSLDSGSTTCTECPANMGTSVEALTDWNFRDLEAEACTEYNTCCDGDDETSCGCSAGEYCHVDAVCADGTSGFAATECQMYALGGMDHHWCTTDCLDGDGTYYRDTADGNGIISRGCVSTGTAIATLCPLSCGTCTRPGRVDTAVCSSCPLGTYHSAGDAADHTTTTLFGYNGNPGCLSCPSGRFADELGLPQCSDCPVGKYLNDTSIGAETEAAACIQCELGKWSDNEGSSSCIVVPCNAGSASTPVDEIVVGDGRDGLCTECAPGFFTQTTGESFCTSASLGTFVASAGATTAESCDASLGQYQDEHHATDCKSCPVGTTAVFDASGCETCPAGKYGPDGLVCTDCSPGQYKLSSTCTESDCPSSSPCENAPPGTFVEDAAWGTDPLPCPAGTYTETEGQTACIACGAGTRPTVDSNSCDNCPVGTYSTDGTACELCPVGRYSDKTDGTSTTNTCQQCADGEEPTGGAPATCVETAVDTSVAQDTAACSQVVGSELDTPAVCEAVMTEADTTVAACSYTPAITIGLTACTQCQIGQLSTGGRQCEACPSGQISTSAGQATCETCPRGKEPTQTLPADSCIDCVAGTASPDGLACVACIDGKRAETVASEECVTCPGGQESIDAISCINCPEGSHKPNDDGLCILCPAGQYQPVAGEATCTEADAGHFVATNGATAQEPCDAGTYQAAPGQSGCEVCDLGFQPTPTRDGCIECESGKATLWREDLCASFNGVPSLTITNICCASECGGNCGNDAEHCAGDIAGLCCSTVILATNTPCINTNQDGAAPCVLSDMQQRHECEDCRPGFYEPDTGSTQCDLAPVGYKVAESGASAISSCSAGEVQPLAGQMSCDACPDGYEADATDRLDDARCEDSGCSITAIVHAPADAEQASEIRWSINGVQRGFAGYSPGAVETHVVPMMSGTHTLSLSESPEYFDGWGAQSDGSGASIQLCNGATATVGSELICAEDVESLIRVDEVKPVCNSAAESGSVCTEFVNDGGQYDGGDCRPVDVAWFGCNKQAEDLSFSLSCPLAEGCEPQRRCRTCTAGKARVADTADGCTACSPGTYASEGAAECTPASKGFYVAEVEATSQTACQAGTYQDQTGQASCLTCPTERNIGCIPTHTDTCAAIGIAGVTEGDDCDAHAKCTYNNGGTPGDTSDDLCETTTAATVCSDEAANGEAACNGVGATVGDCTYTGVPTAFHPAADASACELCPAGQQFAPADDDIPYNHCQPCSAGQYQSTPGEMLCEDAPAGSIVSAIGSSSVERCSGINVQPLPGQAVCVTCADLGLLNAEPTSDHVTCEPCVPGRYGAGTVCVDCEPGQYQPAEGADECIEAGVGFHVPRSGSSAQTQCALGHFQPDTGAELCEQCSSGQVANIEHSDCDRCPAGTFATSRMVECQPCTAGTWAPAGVSECTVCLDGSETRSSNQTACTPCSAGQDSNGARCAECRIGHYAPTEQTSACIPAPLGHYVNESGSSSFEECSTGTVATSTGLGECEECPDGYGVRDTETPCEPCPAQFYGRAGICTPCPDGYTQVEPGSRSCEAVPFDTQPVIGGALFVLLMLLIAMRTWGLCCCAEGGLCGEPADGEDLHVKNHPGGLKVTKHRKHRHHKGKRKERGDDIEDPRHQNQDKPHVADPGHHHTHKHKGNKHKKDHKQHP